MLESLLNTAETSMRQRNFLDALQHWTKIRELYPHHHAGYTRAARACMELQDFSQAEILCQQGMENAPQAIECFTYFAEISMWQRKFQDALTRWAVVRDKFPQHHSGYCRAARAHMELLDFAHAEALCRQGMENAHQYIEPLVSFAEVSMWQRDFSDALVRWTEVREKFPLHHAGYSRSAWACMEMHDFAQAEVFCKKGMKEAFRFIECFISYAEIAMRQLNFLEALNRWAIVREKFPYHHIGYSRAAWACMELNDFVQAEDFALKGIKNANRFIEPFISYAEVSMRQHDHAEALLRWTMAREKFPHHHAGYSRAARVYMELSNFKQAEDFCKKGMENAPQFIDTFINFAKIPMWQNDFSTALSRWDIVRKNFPMHPSGYIQAAVACQELGDFEQAETVLEEALKLFPNNLNILHYYARLPFYDHSVGALEKSFMRGMLISIKFPRNILGYVIALNACSILFNKSKISHFDIYNFLFSAALKNCITINNKQKNEMKIGFCIFGVAELTFYLPVIKSIPQYSIDIILNDKITHKEIVDKFSLEGYNIISEKNKCNGYKYIVVDFSQLRKFTLDKNTNIIGLVHDVSTICKDDLLNKLACAIFSSKKQNSLNTSIICDNVSDSNIYNLSKISSSCKCEIAYTGPYHIGEWFKKRNTSKYVLRKELSEQLECDIPSDKPVITILEDQISHLGQIIYGINKISQFATVILKPIYTIDSSISDKLSKNVIIANNIGFAPNLLRFASDFVLAGYCSGTFLSSIMLGINVLPYYTRLVKNNIRHLKLIPFSWQRYIPRHIDIATASSQQILLYKFKRFFDILDTKTIQEAILGSEYINWYHANLLQLQKDVFGDYMLENSPQKTAEYIMRFVKDGTLGKDCSAVYLKERYFK